MVKLASLVIAAGCFSNLYAFQSPSTGADFTGQITSLSQTLMADSSVMRDNRFTQSQLEDLLGDQNPDIRKAALKSAKNYIHNSPVRDKVLEIFNDRNERDDVRKEAARALCYATTYSDAREALVDIARSGNEPAELRAMAYKALWTSVNSHSQVRDFLADAARGDERDEEARRAAIWSLFPVSTSSQPRDLLLDISKDSREEDGTRVEAIKSLYNARSYSLAWGSIMEMAKDQGENKPVRLAAIRALSGIQNSYVKNFLEDMMRYERDQDLRAAAIQALSPDMRDIREYFHLPYKIENGGFFNPIENE